MHKKNNTNTSKPEVDFKHVEECQTFIICGVSL